jgi:hypothetical protein
MSACITNPGCIGALAAATGVSYIAIRQAILDNPGLAKPYVNIPPIIEDLKTMFIPVLIPNIGAYINVPLDEKDRELISGVSVFPAADIARLWIETLPIADIELPTVMAASSAEAARLRALGWQEHHIVPKMLKDHELIKKAAFDIESEVNKMFLPSKRELDPIQAIHLGKPTNEAVTRVEEAMNSVLKQGNAEGWTQQQYSKSFKI